ncbi:hypothetical protein [Calothrix sp. UHCC 0171]|uniref:hypothetical protein n=1 Tax=Calothrix sp. UHCC 0171 TaxID=3110245 RepID=UPI002B202968|nr:hypothetical protein [Calothrix sp. UHCC 0171]MEA5569539.1 hypothetical protein [Calothrix sp. UHCC 0171]
MKLNNLCLLFILLFLVLIACENFVAAQTLLNTHLPKQIQLRIRTNVPPIGDYQSGMIPWGGFCSVFSDELEAELKIKVNKNKVQNDYILFGNNDSINRFDGLITENQNNKYDIQCGSNSKHIFDILDHKYKNGIAISDVFHTTRIKILLRKEKLDEIKQQNKGEEKLLEAIKSKIAIGVMKQTTTAAELKNAEYNINEYEKSENMIRDLKIGDKIQAFGSDGIILRSLQKELQKSNDYKNISFVIYPENNKNLPGTREQEYIIAISKVGESKDYYKYLKNATDKILRQSPLKDIEKQKLIDYEYNSIHPYILVTILIVILFLLIFAAIIIMRTNLPNRINRFVVRRIFRQNTN